MLVRVNRSRKGLVVLAGALFMVAAVVAYAAILLKPASANTHNADDFVITVNTDQYSWLTDRSSFGFTSDYPIDIDWDNDGVYDEFSSTGTITHSFGEPGEYTITIKAEQARMTFTNHSISVTITY